MTLYVCYSCGREVPPDDVMYAHPKLGTCLCRTCERRQVGPIEDVIKGEGK